MRALLIKGTLLTLAAVVTGAAIYFYRPINTQAIDYVGAIQDKHARLRHTPAPRIILVGGSNVAFGTDSYKIEQALGRPVVNMGIHAGLGLIFMLNEVKADIQRGDLIVLSPEYYIREAEYDLLELTIEFYPEAARYQPITPFNQVPERLKRWVMQIQETVRGQGQITGNDIYKRDAFNERGDLVPQVNLDEGYPIDDRHIIASKDYAAYINQMNLFQTYAESRGARVVFLYPSFVQTAFERNRGAIKFYQQQIDQQLKIPVLNQPETFSYPRAYFFDTAYHLNAQGREKRTEFTIDVLQKELNIK